MLRRKEKERDGLKREKEEEGEEGEIEDMEEEECVRHRQRPESSLYVLVLDCGGLNAVAPTVVTTFVAWVYHSSRSRYVVQLKSYVR